MKFLLQPIYMLKQKNILKSLIIGFFVVSMTSCYAPLSSSKMPKSARKKLHTYDHRKVNAAKYGVQDRSVDCPSSSRRREKY